jgi:Acetyltransferase (GNAT) family
MSTDLEPIGLHNLETVISLINGSSKDFAFEYNLDPLKFLALARFWNFSYACSYLGFVGGEPAGVILNALDPQEQEALTFYWGVLPRFRHRRIAIELLFTFLEVLRGRGYRKAHADPTTDPAIRIGKKLGYCFNQELIELETSNPRTEAKRGGLDVHLMKAEQLFSRWLHFPTRFRYWAQRPAFICTAASFLEVAGVNSETQLEAYAIFTCWPGHTTLIDFRFLDEDAGRQLLAFLVDGYPPPYSVSFVPAGGRDQALLEQAGFRPTRRFTSMTLELGDFRSIAGRRASTPSDSH